MWTNIHSEVEVLTKICSYSYVCWPENSKNESVTYVSGCCTWDVKYLLMWLSVYMNCHLEKDSSAEFDSGLQPFNHTYPEKGNSHVSVKEKDEAETFFFFCSISSAGSICKNLEPWTHINRTCSTELKTLMVSLDFFNLFQDLSQKTCRKFLRASFYIDHDL